MDWDWLVGRHLSMGRVDAVAGEIATVSHHGHARLMRVCDLLREDYTQRSMERREVITPLRAARLRRRLSLDAAGEMVGTCGANLSRIERGMARASKRMITELVRLYEGEVTEMEIMYPERYIGGGAHGRD